MEKTSTALGFLEKIIPGLCREAYAKIQPPRNRGILEVLLCNLELDINRFKGSCQEFAGIHKTDNYYDLQNSKRKLFLQLDALEVTEENSLWTERCKLYEEVSEASGILDLKVTCEDSPCNHCVHVPVVSLNIL